MFLLEMRQIFMVMPGYRLELSNISLENMLHYDKISLHCGETGAIPVRARRREVHLKEYESYLMPQIGEKPLE